MLVDTTLLSVFLSLQGPQSRSHIECHYDAITDAGVSATKSTPLTIAQIFFVLKILA